MPLRTDESKKSPMKSVRFTEDVHNERMTSNSKKSNLKSSMGSKISQSEYDSEDEDDYDDEDESDEELD
jgi:hypothetical protein